MRVGAIGLRSIGLALHELTTNAENSGRSRSLRVVLDVGWGTEGETFKMS
jgi:hypothetical protein